MKLTIITPSQGSFSSTITGDATVAQMERLIKIVAGASDGSLRYFKMEGTQQQGHARTGTAIFPADVVKQSVFLIEGA